MEKIQRFDYFAKRIWRIDLYLYKSYNIIFHYSIIAYYIIYIFWKLSQKFVSGVHIQLMHFYLLL